MPSFPTHNHKSSKQSPPKENDGDYDNGREMNDEQDGGTSLTKERKDKDLERIMMSDLGSFYRDAMTTSGVTRGPAVSLEALQRGRAVNELGSEANKAFITHKKEISGWNSAYLELKNDCGAEELDTMMEGQSHRAQLRQFVGNTGGQRYDLYRGNDTPHPTTATSNSCGGAATRRGRGGGVVGTRAVASFGRVAPTHPALSRGLDPALDTLNEHRARLSRSKRGRRTGQENRASVRGSTTRGRGIGRKGTRPAARAAMVGTTVQVTAATARLPQARQLAPNSRWAPASLAMNPTPKEVPETNRPSSGKLPPALQNNPQYDLLLNPEVFLAAMADTKDRETFNKMIPAPPKPAPASGAAKRVVKSPSKIEKTFNELIQSAQRPSLRPKTADTIAKLNLLKDAQQMTKEREVGNLAPEKPESEKPEPEKSQVKKPTPNGSKTEQPKVNPPKVVKRTQEQDDLQRREKHQAIRQVPTQEPIFRPAILKSTASSADISAWTDGLPSPGMSNFSGASEHTPVIRSADTTEEGTETEVAGPPPSTCENIAPVADVGISDQPTSMLEPRTNPNWDLLMLGTEETVQQLSGDQRMDAPLAQNPQVSGAVADLMDLDFGIIPHDALTPDALEREQEIEPESNHEPKPELVKSPAALIETPAYFSFGGVRYFREDQLPQATSPGTATANRPAILLFPTPAAIDRVVTGTGYTTDVRHLGLHNATLVGDRNLAQRAHESLNPSTIHCTQAESPPVPTGKCRVRAMSPVQVQTEPKLEKLLQTSLSLDTRPAAIGERNLPGRSELVASEDTPNMPRGSSHVEGSNMPRSVKHAQGSAMPREANPWVTSHSTVATARTSDFDGSQCGEPVERVTAHLSKSRPNGPPATRSVDKSPEMTTSSLSEDSILNLAQPSQNRYGSSTSSKEVATSSVESMSRPTNQHSVSMKQPLSQGLAIPSSSATGQHETLEQQMVRMMNSRGATGMTPLTMESPTTETRQARDSISSATHSRRSSRSQSNMGKPNLSSSKWAVEDTGSSLTKISRSAKQEGLNRGVLNANESNTQLMQPGAKIKKGIVRTNAGPGLALLMADAEALAVTAKAQGNPTVASAASSDNLSVTGLALATRPTAQAANPTTCTTSAASTSVAAHTASNLRTNRSLRSRSAVSGFNLTSEPRIRVVNQTRGLGTSQGPAAIQHGRTNFQYRGNNDGDTSSDEMTL